MKNDTINCLFFVILMGIITPAIKTMDFSINPMASVPLYQAIKQGDYEEVKKFLEERKLTYRGYSLNNDAGNFYLQMAIELGFAKIVKLLIECGAEVNAGDCLRRTSLHIAAQCGREEIVGLLIKKSAKINVQDAFYQTPLRYASFEGYADIVARLLLNGANANDLVFGGRQAESKAKRRRGLRLHINGKSKG